MAALAMAAISNAKADGAFLSPRAQANQIQIASPPGTNATVIAVNRMEANPGAMLSPRDRGNQLVKTAGTNSGPDLVSLGLTPDEYVNMVQYGLNPTQYKSPHAKSLPSAPPYEIAPVK
ncbi:MAG TPA: hypothetical protein VGV18_09090 [Verrucomicrobiae bacterium]|nr:hypothetical protein [Verrucomicrobiae bacterium]